MAEACTIFSLSDDRDLVLLACAQTVGMDAVVVEGQIPNWTRITLNRPEGSLSLSTMGPGEPGNRFQQMIEGTRRYFAAIETTAATAKADLLARIPRTRLAVGVVADPEFVVDAHHWTIIFKAAELTGGIVLYQNGMFEPDGSLILDADGNSEQAT